MTRDHLDTLAAAMPEDVDAEILQILNRACAQGLKLATAESCTGGLLASLLTDVKGCSHAFDRGFVTYTDEAKRDMLAVSQAALSREGAVSKEVAIQMAEGGLAQSKADLCIAITGYADDGDGRAPAGNVHFALAMCGRTTRHEHREFGDLGRGGVRVACIRTALHLLGSALDEAP